MTISLPIDFHSAITFACRSKLVCAMEKLKKTKVMLALEIVIYFAIAVSLALIIIL